MLRRAFLTGAKWGRSLFGSRFGFWIQVAISLGLLAVLVSKVDFHAMQRQVVQQDMAWLLAAGGVTVLQIVLAAVRWLQVMRGLGSGISALAVLRVTFIGNFFNAWLLGNVGGDVVRAIVAPAGASGRASVIHSVLFDRAAALTGLGLVILPVLLFRLDPEAHPLTLSVCLAASAAPLCGLYALAPAARILSRWPLPFLSKIADVGASWMLFNRAAPRLLAALLASVGCVFAFALTAYCTARSHHMAVPMSRLLVLMPPVVLLSSLPISVGGWGVRETSMVVALGSVGVPADTALLISVQMALLAAFISLPGGAFWVWSQRVGRRPLPVAAS